MAHKKCCTTPHCKKPVGHIGNCSGKEALTFTRRPNTVQKRRRYRRPPGPAPRDKETHIQQIWNIELGKWITPIISIQDPNIAAQSLVAMASPVYQINVAQATPASETSVPQLSVPQTQINVYAQAQPAPQVVTQPVVTQPVVAQPVAFQASFTCAYLLQQLGAQMNAQVARIVALESRVSALETTA